MFTLGFLIGFTVTLLFGFWPAGFLSILFCFGLGWVLRSA